MYELDLYCISSQMVPIQLRHQKSVLDVAALTAVHLFLSDLIHAEGPAGEE